MDGVIQCLDVRGVQHLQFLVSNRPVYRRKEERTMRTEAPNACGGRFDLNFDLTTPPLPCERVTRLWWVVGKIDRERMENATHPQMTRIFEPRTSLLAR